MICFFFQFQFVYVFVCGFVLMLRMIIIIPNILSSSVLLKRILFNICTAKVSTRQY